MSHEQEPGIASHLARLVQEIGSTRFSDADRATVRQHLLDGIGSAFIGCRGKAFEDLTLLCSRVPEGCGLPAGGQARVHPVDAGMLWAFAINASVYEDGSREGACHPAAVIVPAIVSLSGKNNWETIDRATVAGYDVMVRLARSGNPEFTRKGFHPTAITAPFGAAAAASLLLRHDLERTEAALCLAAMGSAGLMASFRFGPTQPLQVAWGVRAGLSAALLAGAGQSGYPRIIEEGFYPAYLGTAPRVAFDRPLEYPYAIQGSYLKPYPGCRHLHPSIDALADILKKEKLNPARVERIKVRTYKIAVETEIHTLNGRGDAYFNLPFAMAARLVRGTNDWDSFDEKHFTNPHLLEVMKKVEVKIDPEIDGLYPKQRGAIVEVQTLDGNVHSGRVNFALGEPENPLPDSVTREKFRQAAEPFLSKKSMDRLETMLHSSSPEGSAESTFQASIENLQAC